MLKPVLDRYGIGFRVMHGFSGAATIYDVAQGRDDSRLLIVLYVGDYDPSGMWMSEHDLPDRLERYGGEHIVFQRIALKRDDLDGLPSFPAADKKRDPRYKWFVQNYGGQCWELDAMDPNDLRRRVQGAIRSEIDDEAWARCEVVNKAEQELLRHVLDRWAGAA